MLFEETFRASSHPIVAVVHVLLKLSPLFIYIMGTILNYTGVGFVLIFVISVLLLAADFWWTKNVSGRRLVGLRWWTTTREDGMGTDWLFESRVDGKSEVNAADSRIFWTSLNAAPLSWSVLFFMGLVRLRFQWLLM